MWKKLVEASFAPLFLWFQCNLLLPFCKSWCPSHFQSTDSDQNFGIIHNAFAQSLEKCCDFFFFFGNMNIDLDRQVTNQFFRLLYFYFIKYTYSDSLVWWLFFWDVIKPSWFCICILHFMFVCILCCSVVPFTSFSSENWPDLKIAYRWS